MTPPTDEHRSTRTAFIGATHGERKAHAIALLETPDGQAMSTRQLCRATGISLGCASDLRRKMGVASQTSTDLPRLAAELAETRRELAALKGPRSPLSARADELVQERTRRRKLELLLEQKADEVAKLRHSNVWQGRAMRLAFGAYDVLPLPVWTLLLQGDAVRASFEHPRLTPTRHPLRLSPEYAADMRECINARENVEMNARGWDSKLSGRHERRTDADMRTEAFSREYRVSLGDRPDE